MKQKFEINTEIYPEDILKQVISDFSEVCLPHPSPLLKGEGKERKIEFSWDNEEEIEEVFNEFMNYCIWLINEK